jgi:hypothetical protein
MTTIDPGLVQIQGRKNWQQQKIHVLKRLMFFLEGKRLLLELGH